MTNLSNLRTAALALGLAGVLSAGITGCEKKKPPPPPPPPPKAPPPPAKVDVVAMLQEEKSDARVQFAETAAPTDPELAKAAIHLADALARGDDAALRSLLDLSGRRVLDDLVARAEWSPATAKIEAVRIAQMASLGEGAIVTTAIQEPGGAYILNWTAVHPGDSVIFTPMPAASGTKPRASDWDTENVAFAPTDAFGLQNVSPEELQKAVEAATSGSEPGRDPMRKNTPGGPITIPNPGGGSPGGG
jgi:hypothetical protein